MSTKRILVVEDEMIIALHIESTLIDLGHHVTCASTRAEALDLLDATDYDLAVVDYHLNDGDAAPLAAELTTRRVPFIVCSGSTGLEELGEVFQGAAFLAKPFSTEGLLSAISSASGLLTAQSSRR